MFTLTLTLSALFGVLHAVVPEKYHVRDNRVIDSRGRECFFHGVNVIYKSSPYLPVTDRFDSNLSFTTEDMRLLNELGQNIIRLGVMWPGVAPQRGSFNETYIAAAADIIETAYTDYNISSLVDCHQDVFSESLCGEGVPSWAVQPNKWNFPFPVHSSYNTSASDYHVPSREDCLSIDWALYYPTAATSSAFQKLYQNYDGLRDEFAAYWAKLASSYKSLPGVLGFELFNEPWCGDLYHDPSLVFPGVADRKNLAPFYDNVVPSIYENDPDRLVFFESVTWTDSFNVSWTEPGFERVPGGEENANRSVFSFHYYTVPNFGAQDKYFSARVDDGVRWNTTSFVTEFNITNEWQTEKGFVDMMVTMDNCDLNLISWIGWEYKVYAGALSDGTCTGCDGGVFLSNGTENHAVRKALSRTYAQYVAGRTVSMTFDWEDTRNFTLLFKMNTLVSAPTVIYTNTQYWYPNGFELKVSPQQATNGVYINDNMIEIYNRNDVEYNNQLMTVIISPK